MALTHAELQRLRDLARRAEAHRVRLGAWARARLVVLGLGELLGAWWWSSGPWARLTAHQVAQRRARARRHLRAASSGRA
jgi:hypothetical protein